MHRGHVIHLIRLTLSFKCLKKAEPQIFKKKIKCRVVSQTAEVFCNGFFFLYSNLTGVPHSTTRLEVLTSTILPLKQRLIQTQLYQRDTRAFCVGLRIFTFSIHGPLSFRPNLIYITIINLRPHDFDSNLSYQLNYLNHAAWIRRRFSNKIAKALL